MLPPCLASSPAPLLPPLTPRGRRHAALPCLPAPPLCSNSVVYAISPDQPQQPHRFNLWIFAYLAPGVHYLESSVAGLERQVQWCLDNDATCERIAAAARATMQCVLRPEVVLEYTYRLLRHVHDLQQPAAQQPGLAVEAPQEHQQGEEGPGQQQQQLQQQPGPQQPGLVEGSVTAATQQQPATEA